MCGIAGFSGRFDRAWLSKAVAILAHRGPDDAGTWADEAAGIGLAHTRLAILDLSPAGHQPMTDAAGRFTIVYNGELYNFRELRAELESAGARFRGRSDTEVLLELFARHGEAALPRMNGIFAFAVWDRDEKTLFLARDHFGVKPLYYTKDARGFAFASELKALVPVLATRTLDPVSLHRYLTFLWCPGDGTPLREIRKLQPGEAMVVQDGRIVRRWAWYELPARRAVVSNSLSVDEVVHAVAEGLRRAVHRQLVSDVPVGAFLSGGLDSSSVVAMAREIAPELRCFTVEIEGGQDSGFADDLPYARRVARHLDVALEVVTVDAARMAEDLGTMVRLLDEPVADPAPLNVLYISRLARERGIKVLLSGTGGDDLLSGYRRHLALRYEAVWAWLPLPARRYLCKTLRRWESRSALARRLRRVVEVAALERPHRMAGYFYWMPEDMLRSLYTPDLSKGLDGEHADAPLVDFLLGVSDGADLLDRMLALEQRFFLGDHNLAYTDRMSMAEGVEVRVPFLDIEFVELAARIPWKLKQRGRTGKWVLRKAMEPHLPREVIHRPKTGFGAPLRRWLRHDLNGLVADLLSPDTLRRRGLFDPEAVGRLLAQDRAGRLDGTYTIFGLMAIELWCRAFLDETDSYRFTGQGKPVAGVFASIRQEGSRGD